MSLSAEFKSFILELMQGLGPVQVQPMFGGAAVKREGLTFALLDDDTLYLKVDDENRKLFEAEGLGPFTYQTKNGPMVVKGYYRAPSSCLDDEAEMLAWCERSCAVARRAAAHKKPAKKIARKKSPKPS